MSEYHSEIRTLFIVAYCFVIPVILYTLVANAGPKALRDRIHTYRRPAQIIIALGALVILSWRFIIFLQTGH